jgi:hypothetical protein
VHAHDISSAYLDLCGLRNTRSCKSIDQWLNDFDVLKAAWLGDILIFDRDARLGARCCCCCRPCRDVYLARDWQLTDRGRTPDPSVGLEMSDYMIQ